jgi:hypothetical protein
VARLLRDKGYRARALLGGLQAWYDAGYQLEAKTAERGRTVADVCPDCGRPVAAHGAGQHGASGGRR